MYWLDNDSGVSTPPVIPPVVSATRQYFTEGGGGDQPSIPGGEWFNMMTDEVLAVLAAAGITPDKANHTQLAAALAAMFPNKATFSASLLGNGYQKLPSGLIIQWGVGGTVIPSLGNAVTTLPIAFPNAFFKAIPFYQVDVTTQITFNAIPVGLTQVKIICTSSAPGGGTPSYIAIGY